MSQFSSSSWKTTSDSKGPEIEPDRDFEVHHRSIATIAIPMDVILKVKLVLVVRSDMEREQSRLGMKQALAFEKIQAVGGTLFFKAERLKELEMLHSPGRHSEKLIGEIEGLRTAIKKLQVSKASLEKEEKALGRQIRRLRHSWEKCQLETNGALEEEIRKYDLPDVEAPHLISKSISGVSATHISDGEDLLGGDIQIGEREQDQDDILQAQEEDQAEKILHDAENTLARARKEFENHQTGYERDLKLYYRSEAHRPPLQVKEEFDVLHLYQGRKATRRLIEAEEALKITRQKAKAAGLLWVMYDQKSGFGDHPDDGYEGCHFIPLKEDKRASIQSWVDGQDMPYTTGPPSPPEFDEWGFDSEKRLDSVSVVATGDQRRRIDCHARSGGNS
ncbi:hypothetical protein BU16DRAFT_589533 [Lophium mytilinum]|uniref:Uncharacterized protein n=1 Tax=Lophium mytilinum TaxID=390894 RepID=A0A6A6QQY3_9PEZI|nr:hypothetical protein BU16DRAFT_589533 [Lophium mytilinum]